MTAHLGELAFSAASLEQAGRKEGARHVRLAMAEIESLRAAAVGVNVGVPKGWQLVPDRMFPIMGGPAIPWCVIEPCERQARANHGQTLKRLAERGGLDIGEAIAVLTGKTWREIQSGKTAEDLLEIVAARLRIVPTQARPPQDVGVNVGVDLQEADTFN